MLNLVGPRRTTNTEEKSWLEKVVARLSPRARAVLVIALFAASILMLASIIMLFNNARILSRIIRPQMKTINQYTYSDTNAPYFNESVSDFRERVSEQLRVVRPGTIFVSIASFRDNLCVQTIRALFDKASKPDRVFVGLVDQTKLDEEGSDDVPCESELTDDERTRVRLVRMPSSRARGPTHARYIGAKLWDGEETFMQIDAHSQILLHWDSVLLSNLAKLPYPKRSILSHYPPGEESSLGSPDVTWICEAKMHEQAPAGLFVQSQDLCREPNRSPGLALKTTGERTTCVSPFIGGGFFALDSSFLLDAPLDKYLSFLFHGEEVLIAARLWTSGWDIYTPAVNLVSHNYGGREKNVHADTPTWGPIAKLSEARVRYLLRSPIENEPDFDRSEAEALGMGNVRSLSDYLEFAGLDRMSTGNFTSRCRQRWEDDRGWVGQDEPQRELDHARRLPIFADHVRR